MEQAIISGVAHDTSEAKVTVVGVPDKPGEAASIFRAIADAEINIDMVVQNVSAAATGLTDISFTLPKTDGRKAIDALEKTRPTVGFDSLRYDDQIAQDLPGRRRYEDQPGRHGDLLRGAVQRRASTSS